MRYCGISENFHDASIAFIEEDGTISFAAESERYSKRKNDPVLHKYLYDMIQPEDHVSFYEDHDLRKKYAKDIINMMPGENNANDRYQVYLDRFDNNNIPYKIDTNYLHHECHGAAAFYTRPWTSTEDTVILTIDGYGEYQSATIMNSKFELLHEMVYPNSVGLFYALVTRMLDLKPLEEEYIVMGMSAFGEAVYLDNIKKAFEEANSLHPNHNYRHVIFDHLAPLAKISKENLAASIQAWAEIEILKLATIARKYGSKLCYSGGVAQNILANSKIRALFDDMWIAVNPGDGGSALGAAARSWSRDTGKTNIKWIDPYLGFDMNVNLNPRKIAKYLVDRKFCGVMSGRAEFGPRALGNRSLLANPIYDIKDTVNKVKRRQQFRPFAPAILEEYAEEYFDGPVNPYMQYTAVAKHDYKSVTHVDGTARVQIVPTNSNSILRKVLEEFYELTKVPMLLNTSLNVRGKPICNDKYDGKLFEVTNNVRVFGL